MLRLPGAASCSVAITRSKAAPI
ncbi:MAG: hypothetical protein JWP02_330, partial [Acidimicrobiales bacterium]|nr:hypothetical protein [Acidimicrobiales bacterium]